MAEAKAAKKPARRKKRPEGAPSPEAWGPTPSGPARRLRRSPASPKRSNRTAGAGVLAAYRDPLGGNWRVFAGLPIDRWSPPPTSAI